MIKQLRKLFQLSPGERVILGQAWGLFLLAELGLRILTFKRLLALCRKVSLTRRGPSARGGASSVPRLAWLVEVASRYAPGATTCLERALVLSWILGRRGVPTTLRIGVARHDGVFSAHAWLERGGQVILGHQETERYEPLLCMTDPLRE